MEINDPIIDPSVFKHASEFNEQEVRFHVTDPIMKRLGYGNFKGGTYLLLEEQLATPYYHIGATDKKKDFPLGKSDYRAGLEGARGCFIVETKRANKKLTKSTIGQAHSYAAHANVGAHYILLCNGIDIALYETLSGPEHAPITAFKVAEINERFHELHEVLAPANLKRYCHREYDLGLSLCDGLGSIVEVRDGYFEPAEHDFRVVEAGPLLSGAGDLFSDLANTMISSLRSNFEYRISGGIFQRDGDGRIIGSLINSAITVSNAKAMEQAGLTKMHLATDSKTISCSPDAPSKFESTASVRLAEGTTIHETYGRTLTLPSALEANSFVTTRLHYSSNEMKGDYRVFVTLSLLGLEAEFNIAGTISLRLMPR
ncbi:type I restriction enzyme HsdR N-terminal domain-containing protein [Rhizobium leguminosarum]|uniref:type I restriction enzyme HsdR N-terminal domain-containing protein n=1 Tax=Rhizobium leguminosarum TaxID=384 RepID=UPI001C94CE20|nr:type I restriction enzyme HsdR N-terminal domain-containing protein [Rhizobium leguminosarum]MBY5505321.1 type I restriction enzyme HsdR N-terminal domain-containing protein [Rhizobium leguminosarum]